MAEIDGLTVSIGADVGALPRAFGSAEQRVDQFTQRVDRRLGQVDAAFDRLGAAAGRARDLVVGLVGLELGGDLAGAIGGATKEAMAFQTAMAQVSTLLKDTSGLDRYAAQVKAMAKDFGGLPTDQAKGLYEILSAGAYAAANAMDVLTASNKLAIGGVTAVETAADGLTSVLNAYGAAAGGAAAVSDAFFAAAAAGKTNIQELSTYIGQVAPIAAQTGVSLDELMAAAAALTAGGVKTSTAMDGLRTTIAAVLKPSEDARITAQALGLSFSAAALKSKGLAGFLADVQAKTGGSSEALARLFGGVEALLPVMALGGDTAGAFADALTELKGKAGATETAYAKMAGTAQQSADRLAAAAAVYRVELGDRLLGTVQPAMQGLADNFDSVAHAAEQAAVVMAAALAGRALAAGAGALTAALQQQRAALDARAAATVKAAEADKTAAARDVARAEKAAVRAAAELQAAEAEWQRSAATAAGLRTTTAAAEADLTAAKGKSLLTTNVYALNRALTAERDAQAAVTMAKDVAARADAEQAAALARLRTAQAAVATTTETVTTTKAALAGATLRAGAALDDFTRKAGLGNAAMGLLRSAGAGLLGLMGGPWGAALMASAGAVALIASSSTDAERATEAFTTAQRSAADAMKNAAPDAAALAKEYAGLSDSMRAVAALRLEEAIAKQQAALAALRKEASSAVYAPSSPFSVVEGNHGSDSLSEVYGYERLGLAADAVERLRTAVDTLRTAAKDDAGALPAFVQVLENVGRAAGDAGKPLLELARKLADPATKADQTAKTTKELEARLTLLRDPANEAAKAVLNAGQTAATATSGFAQLGAGVTAAIGKLEELKTKAALLRIPNPLDRQVAETVGPAPAGKGTEDPEWWTWWQDRIKATARVSDLRDAQAGENLRLLDQEVAATKRLADARASRNAAAMREAQADVEVSKARQTWLTAAKEEEYRQKVLKRLSEEARGESGEAVTQMKLETAAQERLAAVAGKGEAAQRRARIENEVATAALKGLGEATRQELEAQEEAVAKGLHAAFADQIDLEVAANLRLADAMLKGGEAVREAEVQNAALAQTLKEVPYTEATVATGEWSRALDANVAKLREQQDAADKLDLSRYQQQLDTASRQLQVDRSTIGLSEDDAAAVRARAAVLENLRQRGREYDKLTESERRLVDAQIQQAQNNAALELSVSRQRSAMDALGEAVDNGLVRPLESAVSAIVQGQGESLKWGNILKGMAASLLGDFVKLAAWNPVKNMIGLGSYAPTLWDAVGSGTAITGQTGGGTGTLQAAGTASSLSNIVSGSTSLYNAGQWLATSQAGQWLGMSTAPTSSFIVGGSGGLTTGLQGTVVGNTPAMTGLGSAFAEGLGYSPWGVVGSLGANLLGLGKGADPIAGMALSTLGSIGGGMAGAAAGGAIGGTLLGFEAGSVLGPLGAVVGAALGTALSGLFPADKDYPMAYYYGSIGEGLGNGAELDGGDAAGMTKAGQAAKKAIIQLASALQIDTATLPQGGFFDNRAGHPNLSGMPTGIGAFIDYEGGGWSNAKMTDSIEEAVVQYVRMSLQYSKLDGVKEDVKTAIKNSDAKTVEDLTADLDFADQFSDRIKSMTGALSLEDKARDAGVQAAKSLTDQISTFRETAERLKLDVGAADKATRQWVDALVDGADPTTYTTWEAAVTQLKAQWDAMGPVLQEVGYTAEQAGKKIQVGLNNNLEKLRDNYEETRNASLRQLEGRGYLNDLRTVESQRDTDVRDRKALGFSEKEADADARLRANAVLSQLNAAQLDDVIGTFSGVIKDAALEIRGTLGKSTVTTLGQQQRAAQGRGYLNDVETLVATRDANVAALEKLHQDTAVAAGLFNASLRSLFDGLTADQLHDAASTFGGEIAALANELAAAKTAAEGAAAAEAALQAQEASLQTREDLRLRAIQAQVTLGEISQATLQAEQEAVATRRALAAATDEATRSLERHTRLMEQQAAALTAARTQRAADQSLLQRAYAANGRDYRATLTGQDRQAEEEIRAAMAAGGGSLDLLLPTLEKERATAALTAVQQLIAAQLQAKQQEVAAIRETVEAQRSLRRQLLESVAAFKLDDSVSPLSPQEMAAEAQRQWEAALAKSEAGDTTAMGTLANIGKSYISLHDKVLESGTSRDAFDTVTTAMERLGLNGVDSLNAMQAQVDAADAAAAELQKLSDTASRQLAALNAVPASVADLGTLLEGAIDRSTAATLNLETALSRYSAPLPGGVTSETLNTLFGPILARFAPAGLLYEDGAGRTMEADRFYQLAFAAGHTGSVGHGEIGARMQADTAFKARLDALIDLYFSGTAAGFSDSALVLPGHSVGAYANGGVSFGPQLAWVSEGDYPAEAHVPLPDGRSIPVSLRLLGGAPAPDLPEVRLPAPVVPAPDGGNLAGLAGLLTTVSGKLDALIGAVRAGTRSAAAVGDDVLAALRDVSDVADALPRRLAAAGGGGW